LLRVGNDLVDLTDAEAQPGQLHPRFDQRVFSAEERARIEAGPDPNRIRWSLWAAKESAYKAAKKIEPNTRFIPLQFATQGNGDVPDAVCYRNHRFIVAVNHSERWVHAIAFNVTADEPNASIYTAIRERLNRSHRCASFEARRFAAETVGGILGIHPCEFAVEKERGVPWLRRQGVKLRVDLSLSHHGAFIAFACNRKALEGLSASVAVE
jgi:phosphopantetheinyl transferase (holo-ACP synthase)